MVLPFGVLREILPMLSEHEIVTKFAHLRQLTIGTALVYMTTNKPL